MSFIDDRKKTFELAKKADVDKVLVAFAQTFGRFRSVSITLCDGSAASYRVPDNVRLKPIEIDKPTPKRNPTALELKLKIEEQKKLK